VNFTRQHTALLFASLLIVAVLSSCTQGGRDHHSGIRTGAIGIGPTGGYSPEGMLTELKAATSKERRVHVAARRGAEQALADHPTFHYIPFVKMKQVPLQLSSAHVKEFAVVNGLDTVMQIWIIPHLHLQEVSVSFTTYDCDGKSINSSVSTVPFLVKSPEDLTARSSLSSWEETAYAAAEEALATIPILQPPMNGAP
jgi:roadblock/LC7 domain-containing protein